MNLKLKEKYKLFMLMFSGHLLYKHLKGKGEDFRVPFSREETKRLMGNFLVS